MQHLFASLVGGVGEADAFKRDAVAEAAHDLGAALLAHLVLLVHEAEYLFARAQRLLEAVVEERELADRIVEGDDRARKPIKSPSVMSLRWICPRPSSSSSAIAITPSKSISGELMACTLADFRFARKSRRAALRKRVISHASMLKAFTMPWPLMASCRMFWISAILSCPLRVVVRTRPPMRRAELTMTGIKISRIHASRWP